MLAVAALLAMEATQAAPAQPAPSMVVTVEQFASALPICRDQLAKPQFSGDDLATAGWPKVMSSQGKAPEPSLVTYRHPATMLMVTLLDNADKPDQCAIMVPFGPQFEPKAAIAAVTAFVGGKHDRGGGWPAWRSAAYDVQFDPMATTGARITFTKKGS